MTGVHLDITERKNAESELRDLQLTLNIALEASNTGIWKMNPITGEPLYYGDQWFRQLGYSRDDFDPKQDVFDLLLHPEDRENVNRRLAEHVSGQSELFRVEFRLKAKDGSWKWIESRGQVVEWDDHQVPKLMTGAHLDIAERKESEEKIGAYFNNSSDGLLVLDPDKGFVHANARAAQIFGFENLSELLKCGPVELSPPKQSDGRDSGEAAMDHITIAMREQAAHRFDWLHKRQDGTLVPCEIVLSPISLSGKPSLIVCIRDITERKRFEQEIQEARQTLEVALKSAKMGTWKYFPMENRLEADDSTIRLYGLEEVELDGSMDQWFTFVDPEDAQQVGEIMQHTINNQINDYRTNFRIIKPDRETKHIMSIGKFTYDESGKPIFSSGLVWDITDLKSVEMKLQDRMAELERFSRLTVNREEKMIQLKAEINSLLEQLNQPPKYKIVE